MTKEDWISYCSGLSETYEDEPFAKMEAKMGKAPTLAIRHLKNKKVFAYVRSNEEAFFLTLKLAPERGEALREEFEAITEAYHMNKVHWSDIQLGKDVSDDQLKALINESYDLTK